MWVGPAHYEWHHPEAGGCERKPAGRASREKPLSGLLPFFLWFLPQFSLTDCTFAFNHGIYPSSRSLRKLCRLNPLLVLIIFLRFICFCFLCTGVDLHIHMCATCIPCPQRSEESTGSPVTGKTDGMSCHLGAGNQTQVPGRPEQQVHSTPGRFPAPPSGFK